MSASMIALFVVGIAFLVASMVMASKKRKQKSTSQRLEEVFSDYNKQMEKFRD